MKVILLWLLPLLITPSVANVFRSCNELARNGETENGIYKIDPDGHLTGNDPITVRCNFFGDEDAFTEFGHNHEDERIRAEECSMDGCFKRAINYSVPMQQIRALMSLSEFCSQSILYSCVMAPLKTPNGKNLGGWNSYDGQPNYYFTGDYDGEHMCACGKDNSCASFGNEERLGIENHVCNCDANKPAMENDWGIITSMKSLPITGVFYGPLEHTAIFDIGRLKCRGNSVKDDSLQGKIISFFRVFESTMISVLSTTGNFIARIMYDYDDHDDPDDYGIPYNPNETD